MFGPLLIVCSSLNVFVGVSVIVLDLMVTVYPKLYNRIREMWKLRSPDENNKTIATIKRKVSIMEHHHRSPTTEATQYKSTHRSSSVQPLPDTEVDVGRNQHADDPFETRLSTFVQRVEPTGSERRGSNEITLKSIAEDARSPVDLQRQQGQEYHDTTLPKLIDPDDKEVSSDVVTSTAQYMNSTCSDCQKKIGVDSVPPFTGLARPKEHVVKSGSFQ